MKRNDGITDEQQYAAARADLATFPDGLDPLTAWLSGSKWARVHLAAQEPNPLPDESEMEVVGEWLVVRNAQEPDYPAGPEYGPYPYSDAAPLIQLSRVAGYPPEPQEPTDAEVEAAARAICSGEGGCDPCFNWDDSVDGGCTYCTRHARAALRSARAARRYEAVR